MNPFDSDLVKAFVRSAARRRERDFIQSIRTLRLELMLLRERDRVLELEQGEWAHLEEVP